MYPLCKHCANNVPKGCFVGFTDGLRCEKELKSAPYVPPYLLYGLLKPRIAYPYLYIYVGVWAQVFWHLSLTPLVLSAYALKACSKNSPQRFICCSLYCSSLSFCFYLASFAFSFSCIGIYAPSRSKQNLLS